MVLSAPATNGDLVSALISNFTSHIMYMRGQSPMPSRQRKPLEKELWRLSTKERKEKTICRQLEVIKNDLSLVCNSFIIISAYVVIGPILTSPREFFCMHFSGSKPNSSCSGSTDSLKCVRQLMRRLVEYWSEVRSIYPILTFGHLLDPFLL